MSLHHIRVQELQSLLRFGFRYLLWPVPLMPAVHICFQILPLRETGLRQADEDYKSLM